MVEGQPQKGLPLPSVAPDACMRKVDTTGTAHRAVIGLLSKQRYCIGEIKPVHASTDAHGLLGEIAVSTMAVNICLCELRAAEEQKAV